MENCEERGVGFNGYLFYNDNGQVYALIKNFGHKVVLFRCMSSGKYVVARNLDLMFSVWGGASYFEKDELKVALECYEDNVKNFNRGNK